MKIGIISLDTETTGLDFTNGAVPWEVGWVAAVHDLELERVICEQPQQWQIRLTDKQMKEANPAGLKIGHFDERYGNPTVNSISEMKAALIADCILIAAETGKMPSLLGANPTFDFCQMIMGGGDPSATLFTYAEWMSNFQFRLKDIQAMYAAAAATDSIGLNRIAEAYSIEQRGAHEALDDALTVIRCYAEIYEADLVGDDITPAVVQVLDAPKQREVVVCSADDVW